MAVAQSILLKSSETTSLRGMASLLVARVDSPLVRFPNTGGNRAALTLDSLPIGLTGDSNWAAMLGHVKFQAGSGTKFVNAINPVYWRLPPWAGGTLQIAGAGCSVIDVGLSGGGFPGEQVRALRLGNRSAGGQIAYNEAYFRSGSEYVRMTWEYGYWEPLPFTPSRGYWFIQFSIGGIAGKYILRNRSGADCEGNYVHFSGTAGLTVRARWGGATWS